MHGCSDVLREPDFALMRPATVASETTEVETASSRVTCARTVAFVWAVPAGREHEHLWLKVICSSLIGSIVSRRCHVGLAQPAEFSVALPPLLTLLAWLV